MILIYWDHEILWIFSTNEAHLKITTFLLERKLKSNSLRIFNKITIFAWVIYQSIEGLCGLWVHWKDFQVRIQSKGQAFYVCPMITFTGFYNAAKLCQQTRLLFTTQWKHKRYQTQKCAFQLSMPSFGFGTVHQYSRGKICWDWLLGFIYIYIYIYRIYSICIIVIRIIEHLPRSNHRDGLESFKDSILTQNERQNSYNIKIDADIRGRRRCSRV